jgi:uncharacterized membrane protein
MAKAPAPDESPIPQGLALAAGKTRWYALFSLIFLAATLAEFLTTSTYVPTAITHPVGFAQLVGLYGGGALLIREATVRWSRRWGSVLLLGGAYAVGEEGFGTKSFVDPTGGPLRNQLHSHWIGTNWVDLAGFTLFHAVVSMMIPILLIELIFPATKGRRLLWNVGVAVSVAAFRLAVFTLSFTDPYQVPLSANVFLAVYAAGFITAAYLVPKSFLSAHGERPDRREINFLLLGSGFLAAWYIILYIGANLGPWPLFVAMFVALAALTASYLVRHAGRVDNEPATIAFVLGMILVFVPIDINAELVGDNGVMLFTAIIIFVLIRLRWRLRSLPVISSLRPR